MDGAWKLAMVQLAVRGARPGENLARAIERIGAAAAAGARVALLPEALDVGWTHPTAAALAEPIPEGDSLPPIVGSSTKTWPLRGCRIDRASR